MRTTYSSSSGFIRQGIGAVMVLQAVVMLAGIDCNSSGNGGVGSGGSGGAGRGGAGGNAGSGGWGGAGGITDPCSAFHTCPGCGDGKLDVGEACDDGWLVNGDGCNGLCQIEANWTCPNPGQPCLKTSRCGDGRVTSDETCDDGNTVDGDGCSGDCQKIESGWKCRVPGKPCAPLCGDGLLQGGEECDDGNTMNGDGCSGTCRIEPGLLCPGVDAGGSCDGGGLPVCGDGIVSPDEACDEGGDPGKNPHNDDSAYGGCTTACTLGPYCGDGVRNGSEECDDGAGNGVSYDQVGCTFTCTRPHYCGDGIVDTDRGEVCDLGILNGQAGSQCATSCVILIY